MTSHFAVACFANQLGHGPHGAVDAPAARLEQNHGDQTEDGGGQHHTIESEGKLRHTGMEQRPVIGPAA